MREFGILGYTQVLKQGIKNQSLEIKLTDSASPIARVKLFIL